MLRIRQFKIYLFLLLFMACAYSQSTGSIYGTKTPPGGSVTKKDGAGGLFMQYDFTAPILLTTFAADTNGTDSVDVTISGFPQESGMGYFLGMSYASLIPDTSAYGDSTVTGADSINAKTWGVDLSGTVHFYLAVKDSNNNVSNWDSCNTYVFDVSPPSPATFAAVIDTPYTVDLEIENNSSDDNVTVWVRTLPDADSTEIYDGVFDSLSVNLWSLNTVPYISGEDTAIFSCAWYDQSENYSLSVYDTILPPDSTWNIFITPDTLVAVIQEINFLFALDSNGTIIFSNYYQEIADSIVGSFGDTIKFAMLDTIMSALADTPWVASRLKIAGEYQDTSSWVEPGVITDTEPPDTANSFIVQGREVSKKDTFHVAASGFPTDINYLEGRWAYGSYPGDHSSGNQWYYGTDTTDLNDDYFQLDIPQDSIVYFELFANDVSENWQTTGNRDTTWVDSTGEAASSYLHEQEFASANSPPADWSEVDNSGGTDDIWNASSGNSPLSGSYSYHTPDPISGQNKVKLDFGAQDEVWIAFMWYAEVVTDALSATIFRFRDSGDSDVGEFEWQSDEDVQIESSYGFSGSGTLTGIGTGLHYVKIRMKKGTGSNAEMEIWITDATDSWGSSISLSNGSVTNQIRYFIVNSYYAWDCAYIIDKVVADDSDINITYYQ